MNADTQGGIPGRLKEPTVKLPRAVQLQIENAKRLTEAKAAELKEAVTEKFKQETDTGSHATSTQTEKPITPEKTEVAPSVTTEVKTDDPPKDSKYWEHRFKTNQGIHEAEKTRFKTQITALENRLSMLENELNSTRQRVKDTPIDITKYVGADDIETYGKEMLNTVAKAANGIAQEATDRKFSEELNKHVNPLKQQLEETQSKLQIAQQDKFWETIDDKVPNWSKINDDPRFHEWLTNVDPFTGIDRQTLLTSAQSALDANRVVAMFTAFLQTSAPTKPQTPVESKVVPDPIGQPAMVSNTPEVASISRAEITKFYKEKAIGRYKFRQQEAEQMEKRIQAAIKSGNVY